VRARAIPERNDRLAPSTRPTLSQRVPDDIFLLRGEDDLVAMTETPYEAESVLQELLAKFPTVLAGGDEGIHRWLLISREVSVAGEEGEAASGYLDHLFLDHEGVPTLVEVKRSSDTRVRREVVGQMLDYAANAVAYWPGERLQNLFARRCEREGLDPDAELGGHLGAEREAEEFWEQAAANLKAGRIRLVFVADAIPTSLRRIVEFLNEQMDDAEVVAIEVKQNVGAGLRTLVPRMIGQTAAAQAKRARAEQRQWDESSFFAELATKRGPEEARVARDLLEWARVQMPRFTWGKGKVDGSFIPVLDHNGTPHYPLAIYTYGRIEIQFQWLTKPPFDDMDLRRELLGRLNQIPGVSLPEDVIGRRPSIPLSLLASDPDALAALKAVLDWFCTEVRSSS
jgi:hypothetical protein